ncbi:unknown [Blautia hydrogenotrophica CAG:147]|nr:unknown [Blautia hydrogenotrophica CAG:147]
MDKEKLLKEILYSNFLYEVEGNFYWIGNGILKKAKMGGLLSGAWGKYKEELERLREKNELVYSEFFNNLIIDVARKDIEKRYVFEFEKEGSITTDFEDFVKWYESLDAKEQQKLFEQYEILKEIR